MEVKQRMMWVYAGGQGKTWAADEAKYNEEVAKDPHMVVFPDW